MSINTTVTSTQNVYGHMYWSGVEVLAADQNVGVNLDQGPFTHSQSGASSDTCTFSTTHGASFVVVFITGYNSSGNNQFTCTVSGSSLGTFTLLVSGDHSGQDSIFGAGKFTGIFYAYSAGNLTNEVITATFAQNAFSLITVNSYSGVVASSPIGITVAPTWGTSLTTLAVAFNGVTQGSECLVAVSGNNGNVQAGIGTTRYGVYGNNVWSMGLTNPAGIGTTASNTTGSGGFVVGGSATEGVAYALGTVGQNYAIYLPAASLSFASLTIPSGNVPNGALLSMWNQFVHPDQNPAATAGSLQGSNWRAAFIPQFTYVSDSNWLLGLFVDIAIGVGSPGTYYCNSCVLEFTQATFPGYTLSDLKKWFWFAAQIIPSITDGLQINIWSQFTPSGTIYSNLNSYTLAHIRSDAIAAGMSSGNANSWTPDINCLRAAVGADGGGNSQMFISNVRLYNATSQPSAGALANYADSAAADTNAYADWPLNWAGQASGNGINTGVNLNDQSGNSRSLTLSGGATFFLGTTLPQFIQSLSQTTAGGSVVGGSATQTRGIVETTAGGSVVGGAATQVRGAIQKSAGGSVVGASTSQHRGTVQTSAGGSVVGGASTQRRSAVQTVAGGSIVGGTATSRRGAVQQTHGGSLVGGTATQTRGVTQHTLGGCLLGGLAAQHVRAVQTTQGGAIVGGAATQAINQSTGQHVAQTSVGGSICGGSAIQRRGIAQTTHGGEIAGGATVQAIHYYVPPPSVFPAIVLTSAVEDPVVLTSQVGE